MSKPKLYVNLCVRVHPEIASALYKLKATSGKNLTQLVTEALEMYIANKSGDNSKTKVV